MFHHSSHATTRTFRKPASWTRATSTNRPFNRLLTPSSRHEPLLCHSACTPPNRLGRLDLQANLLSIVDPPDKWRSYGWLERTSLYARERPSPAGVADSSPPSPHWSQQFSHPYFLLLRDCIPPERKGPRGWMRAGPNGEYIAFPKWRCSCTDQHGRVLSPLYTLPICVDHSRSAPLSAAYRIVAGDQRALQRQAGSSMVTKSIPYQLSLSLSGIWINDTGPSPDA